MMCKPFIGFSKIGGNGSWQVHGINPPTILVNYLALACVANVCIPAWWIAICNFCSAKSGS